MTHPPEGQHQPEHPLQENILEGKWSSHFSGLMVFWLENLDQYPIFLISILIASNIEGHFELYLRGFHTRHVCCDLNQKA